MAARKPLEGSTAMSDWARKFELASGMTIRVVDPPVEELEVLRSNAPAGVAVIRDLPIAGQLRSLFFWPTQLEGLEARFQRLRGQLSDDGRLWVIFPKKRHRSEFGVELTWEQMQAAALTTDLVDVKVASFSARSYGTKFVIRTAARGPAESGI